MKSGITFLILLTWLILFPVIGQGAVLVNGVDQSGGDLHFVALSSCVGITDGVCYNLTDHKLYQWNGLAVVEFTGTGDNLGTSTYETVRELWGAGTGFLLTDGTVKAESAISITTDQITDLPTYLDYADIVALWAAGTGLLKTDGTIDASVYLTAEADPVFLAWDKDYTDLINTPTIPAASTDLSDTADLLRTTDIGVSVQTPLVAGTDYLAPDGDGSGLSGVGDITGVLGDVTGDVPVLYQTYSAFTGSDATPDVSTSSHWKTVDTTTITTFDGTPVDGQHLWVRCDAATVFDLTSSGIVSVNRTSDFTCAANTILHFIYDGTSAKWIATNMPTTADQISTTGLVYYTSGVGFSSTATPPLGIPADSTVATIFGRDANNNLTLGVSGTSTNTFWKGNDSATNGDTTQAWSADKVYDQLALKQDKSTFPVDFCVAISDEATDLTAGAAKVTFRAPYAFTLTSLRASVNTAPVGSTIIIDVNEAGTTLMTTNKLSIDASELTSVTAATAHTLTDTAIADDALMTADIDQIGSSTAGKGAKICLYGTREL